MAKAALIVVDVQRDFCEGGALAAVDTLSLLQPLRKSIEEARRAGAVIVYTRDWHPGDHSSFRASGGPWPVHCVANTRGAEFMPPLKPEKGDIIISKGIPVDGPGYSGFDDTGLAKQLGELGVNRVAVTGIATEYCVRATALDAAKAEFETAVLRDLMRAVRPEETSKAMSELERAGVKNKKAEEWIREL
jgi:nicotinamidase/pyrazinamidase